MALPAIVLSVLAQTGGAQGALTSLGGVVQGLVGRIKGLFDTLTHFNTVARIGTSAARAIGTSMIFAGGAFRDLGVAINVAASLFQTLIPIIQSVMDALGPAAYFLAPFAAQATIAAAAIAGFAAATKMVISTGIAFNAAMELNRVTVATLITQYKDLRETIDGPVIGAYKEYTDAQLRAMTVDQQNNVIKERTVATNMKMQYSMRQAELAVVSLTKAAADSQFTTKELLSGFQATFSVLGKYAVSSSQAADLTANFARVASVAGVSAANLASQLTLFLTGSGRITSPLARFAEGIGLGRKEMRELNKELQKHKGNQIETDKILGVVNARLTAFAVGGRLISDTWTGIMSNMTENFELFAGIVTEGLFNKIRDAVFAVAYDINGAVTGTKGEIINVSGLLSKLFKIDPSTGTFFQSVKTLRDLFSGVVVQQQLVMTEQQAVNQAFGIGLTEGTTKFNDYVAGVRNLLTLEKATAQARKDGLEEGTTEYNKYIARMTNGVTAEQAAIEAKNKGLKEGTAEYNIYVNKLKQTEVILARGLTLAEAERKVREETAGLELSEPQIQELIIDEQGMQPALDFFSHFLDVVSDDLVVAIEYIGKLIIYIGRLLLENEDTILKIYDLFKGIFEVLGMLIQAIAVWFGLATTGLGIIDNIKKTFEFIVWLIGKMIDGFYIFQAVLYGLAPTFLTMKFAAYSIYQNLKFVTKELIGIGNLVYQIVKSVVTRDFANMGANIQIATDGLTDNSKEYTDAIQKNTKELVDGTKYYAEQFRNAYSKIGDGSKFAAEIIARPGRKADKDGKSIFDSLFETPKKANDDGDGDKKKEKKIREVADLEKSLYKEISATLKAELDYRKSLVERAYDRMKDDLQRISDVMKEMLTAEDTDMITAGNMQAAAALAGIDAQITKQKELMGLRRQSFELDVKNIQAESELSKENFDEQIRTSIANSEHVSKRIKLTNDFNYKQKQLALQLTQETRQFHAEEVGGLTELELLERSRNDEIRQRTAERKEQLKDLDKELTTIRAEYEALSGTGIEDQMLNLELAARSQFKMLDNLIARQSKVYEEAKQKAADFQKSVSNTGSMAIANLVFGKTASSNATFQAGQAKLIAEAEKERLEYLIETEKRQLSILTVKKYQLAIDYEQEQLNRSRSSFDVTSEAIQSQVTQGWITEREAIEQTANAAVKYQNVSRDTMQNLLDYAEAVRKVRPDIAANIDKIYKEWSRLSEIQDKNAVELRNSYRSGFQTFFEDIQSDIRNVGEAFTNLGMSILKTFQSLIAKRLSEQLFTSLFGDNDKKKGLFGDPFGLISGATGGTSRGGGSADMQGDESRGKLLEANASKMREVAGVLENAASSNINATKIVAQSKDVISRFNGVSAVKISTLSDTIEKQFPILANVFEKALVALPRAGKVPLGELNSVRGGLGLSGSVDGKPLSLDNSSDFNKKRDYGLHRADDIAAPTGSLITALVDGVITKTESKKGGLAVILTALDGSVQVIDRHLSGFPKEIAAALTAAGSKGVAVTKGTPIGLVGETGRAFGAHTHHEFLVPTADGKTFVKVKRQDYIKSKNATLAEAAQNPKIYSKNSSYKINSGQVGGVLGTDVPAFNSDNPQGIPKTTVTKALGGTVAGEKPILVKVAQNTTPATSLGGTLSKTDGLTSTTETKALGLGQGAEGSMAKGLADIKIDTASIVSSMANFTNVVFGEQFTTGLANLQLITTNIDTALSEVLLQVVDAIDYAAIDIVDAVSSISSGGGGDADGFKLGGLIERRAAGGMIRGAGGSRDDKIPAWLSNGEYVIQAAAVKKLGLDKLHELNNAHNNPNTPRFGLGGFAKFLPALTKLFGKGKKSVGNGEIRPRVVTGTNKGFFGFFKNLFGTDAKDGSGMSQGGKNMAALKGGLIQAGISVGLALLGRLFAKKQPKSDPNRTKDPYGLNPDTNTFYKKPIISGSRNYLKNGGLAQLFANGGLVTRSEQILGNVGFAKGGLANLDNVSGMLSDLQGGGGDIGGDTNIKQNINITTPDVHSFRNSRATVERDLSRMTQRGVRRRPPKY